MGQSSFRILFTTFVALGISSPTTFSIEEGAPKNVLPQAQTIKPTESKNDLGPPNPQALQEYTDSRESIFSIRSNAPLEISNRRGGIEVVGWSQDKIKVIAVKKTRAHTLAEAQTLMDIAQPRYIEHGGWIELSAHYGGNLDIKERLKERAGPRVSMDLLIYAPVHLKLTLFGIDHRLKVHNWKNNISLRSTSSNVELSRVEAKEVQITCPKCALSVSDVKGSLKCYGGTQKITLNKIAGQDIYAETSSGAVELEDIEGKQMYVSKSGRINGTRLRGTIDFQTLTGHVKFHLTDGPVSGKTEIGNVDIQSVGWDGRGRSVIESIAGEINLILPARFSAEVEIVSQLEAPTIEFPVHFDSKTQQKDIRTLKHVKGRIGYDLESGYLKVESPNGKIRLKKGS